MVLGMNSADSYVWRDGDRELEFPRGASASRRIVQQRKLRAMVQEATLKRAVSTKLRCSLVRKKTFPSSEIKVGDSVIIERQICRESSPKWRRPAVILDIDETGATEVSESILQDCSLSRT